ncbi:MAG: RHS repeat-associated core domain-containing protein [Sediminibacterium sp.]|nr:RHS repeat-associated core domain-containing protein [Sediminibacterium sp.]
MRTYKNTGWGRWLRNAALLVFVMVQVIGTRAQNVPSYQCFITPNSGCCSNISVQFPAQQMSTSYAGNLATVQMTPVVSFGSFTNCAIRPATITYDFGDGSAQLSVSDPYAVAHTYTLANACITNTFVIKLCLKRDGNPDPYICHQDYTLSVAPPPLGVLSYVQSACKSFSFSYSGPNGPYTNPVWSLGNGVNIPQSGTVTGLNYSYPAGGTYIVGYAPQGFSACPVYTQVTAQDIGPLGFTYTVNNVCDPGSGVQLSISNYTPSLNYQWKVNNQVFVGNGATTTYSGSLNTVTNTIQLMASVPSGSYCSSGISQPVYVGVPTPTFALSSSTYCAGSFISVGGVPQGGQVYTWTIVKPGGQTEPPITGMNLYYLLNTAGVYSVSLQTQNTYTVNGSAVVCQSVSPVSQVTVYAQPNPVFVLNPQSCNNVIGINTTTQAATTNYTLSYNTGGAGYTPYTGTGSLPVGQQTYSYTGNGVYNVRLDLSNAGCVATHSMNVLINTMPQLALQSAYPYICQGNPAQINAVLSGVNSPTLPISYTWNGPNGFTSTLSAISATAGGTYSLQVTIGGAACPYTLTAQKTVTLLANPVATVVSNPPIACTASVSSAVIEVAADLQQQGFYVNGTYYAPNALASNPMQITLNAIIPGPNYVTIANGINNDCQSQLVINGLYNNPVLTVNPTQPTTCGAGALGSAQAQVTPAGGTLTWYALSGYPTTSLNISGLNATNLAPGAYVAKVVDGYCQALQYFSIQVPVLNASKSGANGVCPGFSTAITVNAQFSPAGVSSSFTYLWLKNGSPTTTLSNGSSASQNLGAGNYQVLVTAANQCSTQVNFGITEYDPISISLEPNIDVCTVSGSIAASVSGGDGNYSYNWLINGSSQSSATTAILSVPPVTTAITVSLQVTDQSGCNAGAVPTPSVIQAGNPVTLTSCSSGGGFTVTGTSNAAALSQCDIKACVAGGVSPYTFEWYRVSDKKKVIQWQFYYNSVPNGTFIASNGTQTFVASVPTGTAHLAAQTATLNHDLLQTTVMYPAWQFSATTSPTVLPLANNLGSLTVGAVGQSTNPEHYYPLFEQVLLTAQEDLVAVYNGTTGTTYPHEDFEDGEYKLYVTDANGCRYPFYMGTLTFPKPTVFTVGFDFVWGMGAYPVPEPVYDEDLENDMNLAVNELKAELDGCQARQVKAIQQYLNRDCGDVSQLNDALSLQYGNKEYHHTLYYYDRAGQLTKTVPPEGVEYLNAAQIASLKALRHAATPPPAGAFTGLTPAHRMPTTYQYNSFGQLQQQATPDGGVSYFIYDTKNRLRFSQNAKQAAQNPPVYSYTKYDALGRIVEVGESSLTGNLNFSVPTATQNLSLADNPAYPGSGQKQITRTVYSQTTGVTYYGQPQQFTQNRVSYTQLDPNPQVSGDEHSTYYSYDSHGNVEWLAQQDAGGMGFNYVKYRYDLVSGKVQEVVLNEKRLDRFYHRYEYDAENRLVNVLTSRDGEQWDSDARYSYYAHGPLKRQELGEDKVQGLDYLYTLHGWIKAINAPSLSKTEDPGGDNFVNAGLTPQEKTAGDRHGMVLNYYAGDYKAQNTFSNNFIMNNTVLYGLHTYSAGSAPTLYNGNISSWVQSQLNTGNQQAMAPRADLYKYDLLNRIKESISLESNGSGWQAVAGTTPATALNAFKTGYSYDANGNLLTLQRYDQNGAKMDELQYTYDNGAGGTAKQNNRLTKVVDLETGNVLAGRGDLEGAHSYTYDAIGNLTKEVGTERLATGSSTVATTCTVTTNLDWTVYGKIAEVRKSIYNGSTTYSETVSFGYDAGGNRVRKTYWKDASPYNGQAEPKELSSTYYVRDAQGNTLSTYKKYFNSGTNQYQLDLTEQPIYGSDRIGQNTRVVTLASNATYSLLGIPLNGVVTRSEYQNWLTGLSETANVTGGTGNDFCNCKLIGLSNNSLTPHYSGTTTVSEFLGVAHNGVAVAEDINGALQFYVVLAQQYQGQNNVCLVYDKNGKLMKGAEQIGAIEANSKPVVINYPNTGKYAIITTKQNKQAQYHVVDMGKPGYSPNSAVGEVQSANHAISTTTTGLYGNHYTGIEHHGSGKSMLYASRYTVSPTNSLTGTTDILAYEFTNPNTAPTEYTLHSVPGCGNTERGELQISPYGDKLQWYRMDKSIAGYTYRTGYIYTLPLDATKTAVSGSVGIQGISAAGNLGDGQLETMGDNNSVLYAQRGLYKEGSAATKYGRNVWKYDPLTVTSLLSINPLNATNSYLFGEIKRGRDGKFYIPNMGAAAVGIHSYDGSANTTSVNIAQANYSITGGLPTQVLKIYADPTQTLSEYPRYVGGKVYELKDHLGNVKVTLSDEKQITDANANNTIDNGDSFEPVVMSYQDYYPFGQGLPSRKFTASEEYRYNYNGKELDKETGDIDFGDRIYDARLVKFLSLDPMMADFSSNSPYLYADNSPIVLIDEGGSYGNPYVIKTNYGFVTLQKKPSDYTLEQILEEAKVQATEKLKKWSKDPEKTDFWSKLKLPSALTSIALVFTPLEMGDQISPQVLQQMAEARMNYDAVMNATPEKLRIQTNDPSSLPDQYLRLALQRILNGTANEQDLYLRAEIERRGLISKEAKQLRTGDEGTKVYVKTKAEADKLLREAFPDYKKVRGMGNQDAQGERKKRKRVIYEQGGSYHKDYAIDPETGRVRMHKNTEHGQYPHINIMRTDGVEVIIYIRNEKQDGKKK